MKIPQITNDAWLTNWAAVNNIKLWGVADLRGFPTPTNSSGRNYPFAISWGIPMQPQVMAGIQNGPNQAYADAYAATNDRINAMSVTLAKTIIGRGFQAVYRCLSCRCNNRYPLVHKHSSRKNAKC